MPSSSSLYGSNSTQNSSSTNSTSLYGDAGTPIPDSSGNVIVRGTLTVNGCAILTNCSSFSFLPLNATSIGIGASATSISIGAGGGTTTINNQLATANYAFPVGDGTANQVLVTDGSGALSFSTGSLLGRTYAIDASATSGGANFNLVGSDATTDTVKFASGTGITVSQTNANEIAITNAGVTSITGTANQVIASASTGAVTLSLPQNINTGASPTFAGATLGNVTVGVATDNTISTTTGDLILDSANNFVTVNADIIANGKIITTDIQALTGGAAPAGGLNLYSNDATNAIHLYDNYVQIASGTIPGADWVFNEDGSTDFPSYRFPYADGTANQVLITNGAGVLSFADVQSLDTNYTIQADTTTGGANLTLVGSDATTDSVKFANGTGVTITRTDASTITTAIGQDVAITANPQFANLTLTGDLAVNGGDITTTSTTANLFRTNALTVNIGTAGDGTSVGGGVINIGDANETYETNFNSLISQKGLTTQSSVAFQNQTSTSPILITTTLRRSLRGFITINDDVTGAVHSVEFVANRKASTAEAFITIYAEIFSDAPLATFTAVDAGATGLQIYATKASSNSTDIYLVRNSLGAVI